VTDAKLKHVKTTAIAAAAAIALATALAAAAMASGAPARATPVVFDYWHGTHSSTHFYGAVRPSWLGDSFGAPLSGLRWQSWRSGSASGRGEIFHTTCQPCRVAVQLSGTTRSHGSLYFGRERITYYLGRAASTVSLHWSWSSKNYV
jgi:hypothetical protein